MTLEKIDEIQRILSSIMREQAATGEALSERSEEIDLLLVEVGREETTILIADMEQLFSVKMPSLVVDALAVAWVMGLKSFAGYAGRKGLLDIKALGELFAEQLREVSN